MNRTFTKLAIMSAALGMDLDAAIDLHIKSAQNGHSKYKPHQGAKERARRLARMEKLK